MNRVAPAGFDQSIDQRTGYVDRLGPEALPQLIVATKCGRLPRPRVRRIERDEGLGKYGELDTVRRCVGEQADRFVDAGVRVEDRRRGLHCGSADRWELDHARKARRTDGPGSPSRRALPPTDLRSARWP